MGALVATMIEVDRVRAVEVAALRDVGRLRVQEDTLVGGFEAEAVAVLTEAVDIRIRWELSAQTNVLLLEDQRHR